jgi:glycerophosphoryl diester phosphodiesterase
MVAAHRGFHTHAPENSLPAIRAAGDIGADAVEVDVRHTADDRLVVMHDDTVDRTTDGTGSVADLAFDEIRALHLDTSRYPDFAGEDFVPTFIEALDEARGRMLVYVDMKTDRDDLLVADIQAAAAHDFVMVYSGDVGKLQRVQAADPDIYVFPSVSTVEEVEGLMPLVTPAVIEIGGELDPALVDFIHGQGVKVSRDAMTADVAVILNCDLSAWDVYTDAGIDLVQTNWPEYMLPYLKR